MCSAEKLLGSIDSSLSKRKVRKHLDGLFLFLDGSLDQILDRDHSLQFAGIVDKGQVTNVRVQHFLHTQLDWIFRLDGNQFATLSGNFLDFGLLGRSAQQGNFGNVVTLRNNSSEVACRRKNTGKKEGIRVSEPYSFAETK